MAYNKRGRGEVIKAAIKAEMEREVRERVRGTCTGIAKRDADLAAQCQAEDAQTVSGPASLWAPTGRLRWYRRDVPVPPYSVRHDKVLQQEWINLASSDGCTEWRDIPVVAAEQGEEKERG